MSEDAEFHYGKVGSPTRMYPDQTSVLAAAHEFHERVKAIADETGAHAVYCVADFWVQETPEQKPEEKSAQCVVMYGCMHCAGFQLARCIKASMQMARRFYEGFESAAVIGIIKEVHRQSVVAQANEKVQKKGGYDA